MHAPVCMQIPSLDMMWLPWSVRTGFGLRRLLIDVSLMNLLNVGMQLYARGKGHRVGVGRFRQLSVVLAVERLVFLAPCLERFERGLASDRVEGGISFSA